MANFQAVSGNLTGEAARPTLWRGRPRPRSRALPATPLVFGNFRRGANVKPEVDAWFAALWQPGLICLAAARRNFGIGTADSADFTDFEEVIADERTNLFVAKLQRQDNRNLLYPCNLRNPWLNPSSVLGFNRSLARS